MFCWCEWGINHTNIQVKLNEIYTVEPLLSRHPRGLTGWRLIQVNR